MKLRPTLKPPAPRPASASQKKRPWRLLRARAATMEDCDEEEYYDEQEPSMKLSHAFFVVLILHVIAVLGVFSFNSLKTKPMSPEATDKMANSAVVPAAAQQAAAQPVEKKSAAPASVPADWDGKIHTVAAGDTLTRVAALYNTSVDAIEKANEINSNSMIRVGQALKIPVTTDKPATASTTKTTEAKPTTKPTTAAAKPTTAAAASATDGVYVVAKGDNPYSIAKKLHVGYNELLAVNNIEDATKIQIGQKLKLPPKKK